MNPSSSTVKMGTSLSSSNMDSSNDDELVNNILQDLRQDQPTFDPESTVVSSPPPPPPPSSSSINVSPSITTTTSPSPSRSKINYIKYGILFLLFVIVFVGLTHPFIYSLVCKCPLFHQIHSPTQLNQIGTLFLGILGGTIFVSLQHFIL